MLSVGNTLLIPTPPNNKEHLFIIIAIEKSSNAALLVNITSPKIGCDCSCSINIGEHPFLEYNSVINYGDARVTPISNLEYSLKKSIIKKHSPVSKELLKKIRDGALISLDIPIKYRNFLCSNI
jgi:hypothetical protein